MSTASRTWSPPATDGEQGLVRLPTDRRRRPARPGRRRLRARTRESVPLTRLGPGRRAVADGSAPGVEAVLLAAFAALMARYSGQARVAFGALTRGGSRVVGFDASADTSFAELLRQADRQLKEPAGGSADGDAPVGFALGTPRETAPYGELCLRVVPRDDAVELDAEYDAELFDEATVRRLTGHYRTLLEGAVADPARAVRDLEPQSPAELRTTLLAWNDTRTDLALHDGTIHGAFARRAAEMPDAVAVVDGDRRLTYADVDTAANRLAHHLWQLGVRHETLVGLCLERSAESLVSALAVMKAGGTYVPLDPAYPAARLAAMLTDADCRLVVTRDGLTDRLGLPSVRTVRLDGDAAEIAGRPAAPPDVTVAPDDLCYVIYTSGSTGRPKGIALRHAGVLNNLVDINTRFHVGPGDRVLALSSPGFDMSVYEFLGMTMAGGTVVVPARSWEKDASHWARLIREHRVTVWNSAPSLYELLVAHAERTGADLTSLRLSLCGGDWIPLTLPARVRALAPSLRFISLGGATEASIHSTVHEVTHVDPEWTSIPYGRPMANQRTYVLDAARRPVPAGVVGELHLAGDGLARGYIGDEQLTADRFFTWSYGPVVRERLYRTGDLARYDAGGRLELLGRVDFQVKIRGVRIETGEVEAAVARHPAVKACVVAAQGATGDDRRLVAHAVRRPGHRVTAGELRHHTASLLPAAMVPAAFVLLDALPLTPNGKVDRASLPAPRAADADGGQAGDVWERRVADAWQRILEAGPPGPDDDFFAVGGDSLAAMRIVQLIDPHLPVAEFFGHPTVRKLAARLRTLAAEGDGTQGLPE
ncbi:amino acid adenylation domain-containing protein [Streptomyces sp. NPDC127197]|uniref:non-ribosomal peptide synthetase n=1 Tax=Streptomyces sp. NPDC127197 TaxID=3345388 RepID=UPI00362B9957